MELQDLLSRLDNVKALPSGFSARCPAHDDRVSSLMVNAGRNQGIVLHCHAGCATSAVLDAVGLSMSDIQGEPKIIAAYEYVHADGSSAYIVDRWTNPKTFRVRGHLPQPAERVLYQLPAINWARSAGAMVYIVEGEKDADRLISMGLVATTNVSGAGNWLPHYSESLVDCHVTIVADNDPSGRSHARQVARRIGQYAATVQMVTPRHGKDVSDLLDAGYTLDDVDALSDGDDVSAYIAANVKTRRVEWAWHGYIPRAKLTIIEGDPGDGKSILTVDLAARWSTGAPMPDGSTTEGPWHVFMVSAEDDMEDTIVPRLIAAGAKLENVTLFPHGQSPDRPFEFATDLAALERRAIEVGAKAIIFDPLTAFLSSGVDTHNDMQVRHALYPLAQLARRTGAAVPVVRHLNKGGQGTKAIYRGNGSIAFTGAARAGFLVTQDPDDDRARLLACVKSNIAHKPPSMRYVIESTAEEIPYIVWRGASDLDAQTALDGMRRNDSEMDDEIAARKRMRKYEIEFLSDILRNGPMTWTEIVEAGKPDGFREHSLRRARADMGLIKVIGEAGNATVRWMLREVTSDDSEPPFDHLPSKIGAQTRALKDVGKWSSGASGQSEEDRAQAVEDAPLVCEICQTDIAVARFLGPWWTVRCVDHDPREYGAGNDN